MVKKDEFRVAAKIAVQNLIKHGDTDIFPRSFEGHAIYDKSDLFVDLICEYDENFDDYLARFPPSNTNALIPVSYYGFRWGTQMDPVWNAHFLSCVIALSAKIEATRIRIDAETIYSYRYRPDEKTGDLFDRNFSWHAFMMKSLRHCEDYEFVTTCDISEFYPRLGHHRLENALLQIAGETAYPKKIMSFLANFSNTRSFGLPIGGPAARILSELTINQIDRLLQGKRIPFVRFADDFHLFAHSREEAYRQTIFLSEKLFENQGLSLQKSKTRIMTTSEFRATCPVQEPLDDGIAEEEGKVIADKHERSKLLLSFSLRFDPYSPTAEEDYQNLKNEVRNFDILGLLKEELAKSRVHIALSRKIVSAIHYLEGRTKDDAVLSVIENSDVLYPIFSSALIMMDRVFGELGDNAQKRLTENIIALIHSESHVFRVDVHLCFALRVLQHLNTEENQQLIKEIYETRKSDIVRRDIILIMALWGDWYWLSDLRNQYRQLSGPEKRALLVASYALRDEGKHWREHIRKELNPFEKFILSWAGDRVGRGRKDFPL
ncbi:RNA-directed DNA polymerase [Gluconacetobacter asukensis]|uniref:RNA-directed DNA polymerase n=1 Tax=Gluconacetobacter asukensis TaxID=1017181 RepID=A0A7W4P121_9PROT|nr:RNA-directed DNA polymerase [Gluconacetobacter asukensis]MBB2173264.1 RNA-directed DNA polymerase [Gluconacetobacter asukensis]